MNNYYIEILATPLKDKPSLFLLISYLITIPFSGLNFYTLLDLGSTLLILYLTVLFDKIQESKKGKLDKAKLADIMATETKVLFENKLIYRNIVYPGDIIYLTVGDKAPCDLSMISNPFITEDKKYTTDYLWLDESIATGESKPQLKTSTSEIYSGSFVLEGSCYCLALPTITLDTQLEKMEDNPTQLMVSIEKLGETLTYIIFLICFILFLISTLWIALRSEPYKNILWALRCCISLAVTAMPEGLSLLVRICLYYKARKLADSGVLVKTPQTVEKLGMIDFFCTDKTGTLTQPEHESKIFTFNDSFHLCANPPLNDPLFYSFFSICNNLIYVNGNPTGDPLDIGMLNLCNKEEHINLIEKRNFTCERGYSSALIEIDGIKYEIIKGAFEKVRALCDSIRVDMSFRHLPISMLENINVLERESLRVISCAYRKIGSGPGFVFWFVVGFYDKIRPGVANALKWCEFNNLSPMIITGDSLETTKILCKKLNLLIGKNRTISGDKINNNIYADKISVVYRATPFHKLEMIKHLSKSGKGVLMVGDGTNDSLALKESTVGIVFSNASALSKELSDVIISHPEFYKIIECIESGKSAIENLFCVIKYLVSSNLGELLAMILCYSFGYKECLSPSQMLLVNLITDGLPSAMICMSNGIAEEKRPKINITLCIRIILTAIYIGSTTFFVFTCKDQPHAFVFIIFIELLNSLNCLSLNRSLMRIDWMKVNKNLCLFVATIIPFLCILTCFIYEVDLLDFVSLLLMAFPVVLIEEYCKIEMNI
ncbi:Calcium-transporting ATPase 1 [Astathelohania contejeani]|uniref:Calcium-transporting ATPase 1 n=1 Tax=Astathelohania contejeani TaxID=164912 RepID=A0ABQ7I1R0_9MICR|nr:Calcium-transporting ATPase 1 [Thelohania contejeani]